MDTGGKIRTGKILAQLAKSHEITLVSNVESSKDDPYLKQVSELCDHFISVPWREMRRYSPQFLVRLFFQMFSRYPVSVLNTCSRSLRSAVEAACAKGDFDVVVCDFVQAGLLVRNISRHRLVLFQHNVESVVVRRHFEQAGHLLAKLFWWGQWMKMRRYESGQSRAFDSIVAVSATDKQTFENLYGLTQVRTISTGVDADYFRPQPEIRKEPMTLVFCGSMDWLPNEDGMSFFLESILPLVKTQEGEVRIVVVGRNPSALFQRRCRNHPEVQLTGWVDDTRPYIARASLFIVPLRIGGGTRMKIYEAMAMGKTVISTSIGAEGLPVQHGENILIADRPNDFADEIVRLLSDPDLADDIGRNARRYVAKNFAWTQVAGMFAGICRETAQDQGSGRKAP